MKAWSGLIRTATILAPVAILLFWGGTYLLACAEFLANPGVPLRFTYKAPAGELTITAESYVLNTKNGDLTLVQPKVQDPKGVVLLYAKRIEAKGLPLLNNDARRAVVTVKSAYATVQRKSDGKFDLLDYLPKQEGPSSDFPFAVDLDQAKIKYVELSTGTRHIQNVTLTGIHVDGVGQKWIASGEGNIEGSGKLTLSLQNLPDEGIWVRGETGGLELADLFKVFRLTPEGKQTAELQNIDATSAKVRGPFEVFIPSKAGARFQTSLVADLENFRYGNDYRADQVRFEGSVGVDGAQGILNASQAGLKAEFKGTTGWRDGFAMNGELVASTTSLDNLPKPLRTQIPRALSVKGPVVYEGTLAYSQPNGIGLNGKLNASEVRAYDESIVNPIIQADISGSRVTAKLLQGKWRNSPVQGSASVDTKTKALAGSLAVHQVDLAGLSKRVNFRGLQGVGDADILLDGTLTKPVAYIKASSQGSYTWNPKLPRNSGELNIAATLRDGKVRFDQAYLVTKAGSVSASGTYDLNSRTLDVDAVGSGIDLYRFDPRFEGIGRFKAEIKGTVSKPKYTGEAELFGLRVQDQPIPIATTRFFGDLNGLVAENLRIVKGASVAEGKVRLGFKKLDISGDFQAKGVQLSDFLGEDYLAFIDLNEARLSGTLSKPVFSATAEARDILLQGTKLDAARALVTYKNDLLQIDGIEVNAGSGGVEGFLSYDVAKKKGQANFTAEKISIADFIPKDLGANVSAMFSGEAGLTFDENGFKVGSGEGKFGAVTVNDTLIGDGDWKVSANGQKVTADAFFGGLGTSVDLTGMSYDLNTKLIGGNVWVRNLNIDDITKISKPYLPNLDVKLASFLDRADGFAGFSVDLGGTMQNPDLLNGGFDVEKLDIEEIADRTKSRPGGDLRGLFNRQSKLWTIENLEWKGGPVSFQASGTAEESGQVDITGNANGIDLSYLSLYDSAYANLSGTFDLKDIKAEGFTKSPVIHANMKSNGISVGTKPEDIIAFDFKNLLISETALGGIDLKGNVQYRGYQANVTANVPLKYPLSIPADELIKGSVSVRQDLSQLLDPNAGPKPPTYIFDPKKSIGTLSADVNVAGTKDDLGVTGGFRLLAEQMALAGDNQVFKDVDLEGIFKQNRLDITLAAKSADGGTVQGNAFTNLPPLEKLISTLESGGIDELMRSPIEGKLTPKDFSAKIKIGDNGSTSASIGGDLAFAGTLGEPLIKGELTLNRAAITMPNNFPEPEAGTMPSFSPQLDLRIKTVSPAKFKSSTAEIEMSGTGTVLGNLNDLDVSALLRVQKGLLKLPTARVTLQQGGTIRPLFTIKDGVSTARMDVELEGKTKVVSARYGQTAQRYDVTLDVRGDLLKDAGLTLVASSDPPDLSQDEILALLGQVQLIEGLAAGGNPESQVREAFFGIAVPYLLDPFTSQVARAFGLDYLSLDINPFDGATISFGKTLGRNLSLTGSRQVTQTNPAFPIKYDLRLAYQFRVGRRDERKRWSFLVGTDELRPYKIGVEYSFRF